MDTSKTRVGPTFHERQKQAGSVQKFGLRLAARQFDAGYRDLLYSFDLPTLEERRTHLKLGLLFKIMHTLCYSRLHLRLNFACLHLRLHLRDRDPRDLRVCARVHI